MKKIKFISLITATLFMFVACETFDLDQVENPNAVSPDQLDVDFVFNRVQLLLPGFVNAANFSTMRLTRQMAMTGGQTYETAFSEVTFNGLWNTGYTILNDIKALEGPAAENNQNYHLGVSKVIKAYVSMTMADLFGDIPYSEALQGSDNLFPAFDASADVYIAALADLNEGISLLAQPTPSILLPRDELYFFPNNTTGQGTSVSKAKWLTAAKTIKLKMLNTARLNGSAIGVDIAAEMTALINEDDLISTADEDFHFNYGDSRSVPNTRHPFYNTFYESDPGGTYLSNYFMWQLVREKSVEDPRTRFYFFRQDINANNETIFTLGCLFQQPPSHYNSPAYASIYEPARNTPFCTAQASAGYWGRDHGDASGLPPDAEKRTVPGVYPAGGKYDAGNGGSVQEEGTEGFQGAGIMPIMLSSWVDFIKAEAALTLGTPGDPRALLESGIRKSISKTTTFIDNIPTAVLPTPAAINAYVNYVLAAYDAESAQGRLEIVMKEYHIAAWGNGIETYNNYRRTGYPSNMQPTLNPSPGAYYATLLYPANSVANNPNAPINVRTKEVFWDTATNNLH